MDLTRASRFYSAVFDWEFSRVGSPSGNLWRERSVNEKEKEETYMLFRKPGTSVYGGLSLVNTGQLISTDLNNVSVRIGMRASSTIEETLKKEAGRKTLRFVLTFH